MRVGVITRGKYGHRLIDTILEHTDFQVVTADVPDMLPDFIEDPPTFLQSLGIDSRVFESDMVVMYTLHPDITPELVKMAGERGVKAVIIPGGMARAGSLEELKDISRRYSVYIEVDEICCTLEECGIVPVDEFSRYLGRPKMDVKVDRGKISSVKVLRGSPCGATWHVARELVGKTVDEAPAFSGLYCQQYPCRAVRGTPGGIHTSADLHKHSMEKALGIPTDICIPRQSMPIRIWRGEVET